MADKITDYAIEQKIVIGLIVSDIYIQHIHKLWNPRLFQSKTAKRIASWCMEYYDKYNKAPFHDIENIYLRKLKEDNLAEDVANEIEQDILPELSSLYENSVFNSEYLLDQTKMYFREQSLKLHISAIENMLEEGNILGATEVANEFAGVSQETDTGLNLHGEEVYNRIDAAFEQASAPLITYPYALGQFWNTQLVRGGFVALLAPEKRGKTFMLLDMAIRAIRSGSNVAFIQAGDMTEPQQLLRISTYITKKPRLEKYCGDSFMPVVDCIFNQFDECERPDRFCDFGVYQEAGVSKEEASGLTIEAIKEHHKAYPDYIPCKNLNCNKWMSHGSPWIKDIYIDGPLTAPIAKKELRKFIKRHKSKFKLSTHPGNLTVKQLEMMLNIWEKQENFVPDVIIIDYADLFESEGNEFRHKQNAIWKGFRKLTFEKHCLLITATQADAMSYKQNSLNAGNFSEDKRKYAHVTAIYGMNQDKEGREKAIGLLRLNELMVREDDFHFSKQVKVLQKLAIGKPVVGSFF